MKINIAVVCDGFQQFKEHCLKKHPKPENAVLCSGSEKFFVKENKIIIKEYYCISNQHPSSLSGFKFNDVEYIGSRKKMKDLFDAVEVRTKKSCG